MNSNPSPAYTDGVLADLVPRSLARDASLIVGLTMLLAISAKVAFPLPFTPVPVTGQTLVVLGGAVVLGASRSSIATALYLVVGLAGAPLLATGGATLGYVIGFVAAAAVVGRLADHGYARGPASVVAVMIAGNVIIYAFGVGYLAAYANLSFVAATGIGVMPFLVGDAIKVALAATLVPLAWRQVGRDSFRGRG